MESCLKGSPVRIRGFLLGEGTTTVGSGEGADLRLEGLESEHAMIVHDQFDE